MNGAALVLPNEKGWVDGTRGQKYKLYPFQQDVGPYLEYVKRYAQEANDALDEFGLNGEYFFDPSDVLATPPSMLLGVSHISDFLMGDMEGIIYAPQARTTADIMRFYRKNPGTNVNLVGVTQSGKTGTLNNLYWEGPRLFLEQGIRTYPFYLMPNKQALLDQSNNEFERFRALVGNVKLVRRNRRGRIVDELTLNYFHQQVLRLGGSTYNPLQHRFCKTKKENQVSDRLEEMIALVESQGARLHIILDEGWHSSGLDSIQADLMERILPKLKLRSDDRYRITIAGATDWPLEGVTEIGKVRQRLSPTPKDKRYAGYNYFNGEVVDPDADTVEPTVWDLEDWAKFTETPELANIRRSQYGKGDTVTDRQYERAIAQGLNQLFRKNPHNGLGCLLRAFPDISRSEDFIKRLEASGLDPRIETIPYYGDAVKRSIKHILAARADQNRPYLVVAVAAARYADSFPPSCTNNIDLAENITTLTAFVQGIVGRASGFGKNPLVILYNKRIAERYVELQGLPFKKPHYRVVRHKGGSIANRPHMSINIPAVDNFTDKILDTESERRCDEDPVVGPMLSFFRSLVSEYARVGNKRPKGGYGNLWEVALTEDVLKYIEEHSDYLLNGRYPKFSLLRPGEVDDQGLQYSGSPDDGVYFSLRNTGKDSNKSTSKQAYVVQIHIGYANKKNADWGYDFQWLQLRLRNGVHYIPSSTYPKNDWADNFLTPKQLKERDGGAYK